MKLNLLTDLIRDERGNYYTIVHQQGNQITLVHALLERSYRRVYQPSDPFYASYEGQFIGKIAADDLRHDVVFAMQGMNQTHMYSLDEVKQHYQVEFIDTIEFYRNPKNQDKNT